MLEIPLWMLDAVACATMRYAPDPVADLRALAALKVLLEEASARATSPEDIQGLTVASPDRNRGDRHGTQTPPLSDQTPAVSVRSLRGGAADRACPDAELEHIADTRLDDAYEERLLVTGDDLMPIAGIEKLVEAFIGRPASSVSSATMANGNSSTGTAAARAFAPPASSPSPTPVDLPTLGDDPTAEELEQYALAHPTVKAAMNIFRAKIVKVTKR